MGPVEALRSCGGVARWTELQARGVARSSLLDALNAGVVVRPHRGCFALPEVPRSGQLAAIFRSWPTCVTACVDAGLPLFPASDQVHLAVPRDRGIGEPGARPMREVVVHRLPTRPRTLAEHIDVTARCVEPLQQLALIDAALHTGRIAIDDVEGFHYGTATRRRWLRERADARAESISETYARVALVEAGFEVVPQHRFSDVGRVDLWVEGAVVVELDGASYHSDPAAFSADRSRDRRLAVRAIPTLRYPFIEAVHHTDAIVADVTAVLWRQRRLTPTVQNNLNRAARVSRPRERT